MATLSLTWHYPQVLSLTCCLRVIWTRGQIDLESQSVRIKQFLEVYGKQLWHDWVIILMLWTADNISYLLE